MSRDPVAFISVQEDDFDVGAETHALYGVSRGIGAVVTFSGLVRDFNDGDGVTGLYLEHYPAMTRRALEKICETAAGRWDLLGVRVIHRVGQLQPGDQIVFVGVAGAHRGEAFEACQFIMDYLKTEAPFWKKERVGDRERWVEARQSDQDAKREWSDK